MRTSPANNHSETVEQSETVEEDLLLDSTHNTPCARLSSSGFAQPRQPNSESKKLFDENFVDVASSQFGMFASGANHRKPLVLIGG